MRALPRLRSYIVPFGALALAGCGEMTPDEQARSDALVACAERADALFPVLKDIPEANDDEQSGNFHVDVAGGFALTWKTQGKNRPLPDELECRGNLTGRTIEFVELNGVTKRPNPSEVWKY
jgi:hypothetical protein